MVVSVMLKIKFGAPKLVCPNSLYRCRKQSVSTPDCCFTSSQYRRDVFVHLSCISMLGTCFSLGISAGRRYCVLRGFCMVVEILEAQSGWISSLLRSRIYKGRCTCSLCPERHVIARARAITYLNQFSRTKICAFHSNKYYKHCIVCAKFVSTIIFLIMKITVIFNKNLHNKNLPNDKLLNALETRVHFLEISLKFKYS